MAFIYPDRIGRVAGIAVALQNQKTEPRIWAIPAKRANLLGKMIIPFCSAKKRVPHRLFGPRREVILAAKFAANVCRYAETTLKGHLFFNAFKVFAGGGRHPDHLAHLDKLGDRYHQPGFQSRRFPAPGRCRALQTRHGLRHFK